MVHSTISQQSTDKEAWIEGQFEELRQNPDWSSEEISSIMDSVFTVAKSIRDICSQVRARIFQSSRLDDMGLVDSALSVLYWADQAYTDDCGEAMRLGMYINLTSVYVSYGEVKRIDSVGNIAIQYAQTLDSLSPEMHDDRLGILVNLAISQAFQENLDTAALMFRNVFHDAVAVDNEKYAQRALLNLATIKGMNEELDSAYYFLNEAAKRAQDANDVETLLGYLINLANVEMDMGLYRNAHARLDSARALSEAEGMLQWRAASFYSKAELYKAQGRYLMAYDTLAQYIKLQEEFLNEERLRAVTEMMERYESERKARQIQQLELENLDTQLENDRIRNARNRTLWLGGIILVAALGLLSRLRVVRRSRAEVQKEKDVAENLLLNILPSKVAAELKEKGKADARYYDTATIMFSDFKDFTRKASTMEAEHLVASINAYFKAFDEITTRYRVEKIKTIGDSYMAAGGIEQDDSDSVVNVVKAAIAIQQFVIDNSKPASDDDLPMFEMRVGVHSGPVVAGIVGVKKFQYDLWGDTVNIASRMETAGVPEKVNISRATYDLIKHDPTFTFESRGMIHAKGLGEMEMFFVSLADQNT